MSLLSAQRRTTALSPPLSVANKLLNASGVALRRGQFSLVAAAPGVGKSLLATNLSIFTKVPTLFFSADSDEWTVRTRACSILSGYLLDDVEKQLNEPNTEAYYTEKLRASDHVDWCFRSDIELEFVVSRLNAYAELRGDYPQLIVVDNLGNCISEADNEYAELREICRELQRIARQTQAHVMALHHVKGAKESGTVPIGLGDLLGNIGKVSEVVLGLHHSGENQISINIAKNRGGRAGFAIQVPMDYATATMGGFR